MRFDALLMLWGCFRGETARSLKLCDLFLIEYPDIGPAGPSPLDLPNTPYPDVDGGSSASASVAAQPSAVVPTMAMAMIEDEGKTNQYGVPKSELIFACFH